MAEPGSYHAERDSLCACVASHALYIDCSFEALSIADEKPHDSAEGTDLLPRTLTPDRSPLTWKRQRRLVFHLFQCETRLNVAYS